MKSLEKQSDSTDLEKYLLLFITCHFSLNIAITACLCQDTVEIKTRNVYRNVSSDLIAQ